SVGGGGGPLVEHEVVPGGRAQPGQLHVVALPEQRAGELRELREAQGRLHAVEVHVLHPLDGVVAARDHVVVADGVEPERLGRLPGHRVETHLGVDPALVAPGLAVGLHVGAELAVHALVAALHHLGAELLVPGRHAVEPDAGVLDEVVVDRDQLHVVLERHGQSSTFLNPGCSIRRGGVPHQKEESIGRLSEVTTTLNVLNRPRLVDDVVKVLREKIIRGELPAGTQLLQIDLANQLGVSRTPLREAFRILENDGYLKTSNNNRTVEVVTFTAAEMRDMYEIREVIDGLAARLAAARGLSAGAEAEARRLLAEMARTSKPP